MLPEDGWINSAALHIPGFSLLLTQEIHLTCWWLVWNEDNDRSETVNSITNHVNSSLFSHEVSEWNCRQKEDVREFSLEIERGEIGGLQNGSSCGPLDPNFLLINRKQELLSGYQATVTGCPMGLKMTSRNFITQHVEFKGNGHLKEKMVNLHFKFLETLKLCREKLLHSMLPEKVHSWMKVLVHYLFLFSFLSIWLIT